MYSESYSVCLTCLSYVNSNQELQRRHVHVILGILWLHFKERSVLYKTIVISDTSAWSVTWSNNNKLSLFRPSVDRPMKYFLFPTLLVSFCLIRRSRGIERERKATLDFRYNYWIYVQVVPFAIDQQRRDNRVARDTHTHTKNVQRERRNVASVACLRIRRPEWLRMDGFVFRCHGPILRFSLRTLERNDGAGHGSCRAIACGCLWTPGFAARHIGHGKMHLRYGPIRSRYQSQCATQRSRGFSQRRRRTTVVQSHSSSNDILAQFCPKPKSTLRRVRGKCCTSIIRCEVFDMKLNRHREKILHSQRTPTAHFPGKKTIPISKGQRQKSDCSSSCSRDLTYHVLGANYQFQLVDDFKNRINPEARTKTPCGSRIEKRTQSHGRERIDTFARSSARDNTTSCHNKN